MPDVVRQMHTASGLLDELAEGTTLADAEAQVLAGNRTRARQGAGKAPLCGNSVGTAASGVSVVRHAGPRGLPPLPHRGRLLGEGAGPPRHRAYFNSPEKNGNHRALADIRESIAELRYYREAIFVPQPGPELGHRPHHRGGARAAHRMSACPGPEGPGESLSASTPSDPVHFFSAGQGNQDRSWWV